MKTYNENTQLTSFNFWSGAVDNAKLLTYSQLEQVDYILEDMYPDGMSETALNDIFWFEFDTVCEWLDLNVDEFEG
jgi:hypothetical protein